jgi:hypothetical protein
MYCNIEKYVLQHQKLCTATSQIVVLQHRKNICCNIKKIHCNTEEIAKKKCTKQPWPITLELARTLATVAPLKSRGGGGELRSKGGGGLRSIEGPTYLVKAAAVVLVSGVGREGARARRPSWGRKQSRRAVQQ